jgi:pimeloyl-ACP methyl ester carboxylesterase
MAAGFGSGWCRRSAVGLAVALVVGAAAAVPAAARSRPAGPQIPALNWSDCAEGSPAALAGFVCATAEVPLDYSKPRGTSISLAVVKHAATEPVHRLGTLFINPGGPGGTGTGDVPNWFDFFPVELQQRFDIVSWDPRGIGESTPVQCFASGQDEAAFLGESATFPITADEQQQFIETWRQFGKQCKARDRTLLGHVSTADVARDLDLLRRAVGAPKMNYLGLSYGTFLGATYANLFPNNIRTLALDGNLAPSVWTANGDKNPAVGISLRIGSDRGAAQNLAGFLDECGRASTTQCAFSNRTPAATTAKFDALIARLLAHPVVIGDLTVTASVLLTQISEALDIVPAHPLPSNPSGAIAGWSGTARAIQMIWLAAGSPTPPSTVSAAARPVPPFPGAEGPLAVTCGDSPQPRKAQTFIDLVDDVVHRDGLIGVNNLWVPDEACVGWPVKAQDPYAGPWNRPTPPILVIGNTADPSTPYANSLGMVQQLANAHLLTVVGQGQRPGYGHTAFLNPSTCANNYLTAYFETGALPPAGTICHQSFVPFP